MTPMFGRIRHRHSADVRRRFVTETIDGLQTLHRRIWEIEERLQEQQATNAELERRTRRAEVEASPARLGFQEIISKYATAEEPLDGKGEQQDSAETAALEAEQSPELLDGLMRVLTPIRSAGPTAGRQPDAGPAHLCFFPTPQGYQLLELPGSVPTIGSVVDLGEHDRGEVAKVARSPLLNDMRQCAYLLPIVAKLEEAWTPEEVSESLVLVGG
jgi:hypothetical protein